MPGEHAIRPSQNINYRTMSISLLQPLLFFAKDLRMVFPALGCLPH